MERHRPRHITIRAAHTSVHHTRFNEALAVLVTRGLSSMWCAYIFAALALYGFPGWHSTPSQYVQWLSQTFIQLVALSVLAVGQSVLGKHAEMQSEEAYKSVVQALADVEEIKTRLAGIEQALQGGKR